MFKFKFLLQNFAEKFFPHSVILKLKFGATEYQMRKQVAHFCFLQINQLSYIAI